MVKKATCSTHKDARARSSQVKTRPWKVNLFGFEFPGKHLGSSHRGFHHLGSKMQQLDHYPILYVIYIHLYAIWINLEAI